jgi:hypothetical protein
MAADLESDRAAKSPRRSIIGRPWPSDIRSFLSGRSFQWIRLIYLLAAASVSCWLLADAIPRIIATTATSPASDLASDYLPARAIVEGYDPYTPEGLHRSGADQLGIVVFGHPPSAAFWVLPLARLNLKYANMAWCWITILTFLSEIMMLMNVLRCPAPNATAWLIFSYFVSSPVMLYHLGIGQFSQAIGFLLFLTWFELRNGREITASVSAGAACTMKAFPFLLLFYFLITRRYRAFVVAIMTDLAITTVMTAKLGLRSWTEFLRRQPAMANRWMNSIQNFSVQGIVSRCFSPACGPQGQIVPAATVLSGTLAVMFIGVVSWWTRRLSRDRSSFDATFAIFVILSVFTSQWAWEHYKLIYILPLAILVLELTDLVNTRRPRWLIILTTSAILLTCIEMQISPWIKVRFLDSVRQGNQAAHFRLHFFEILNWAPTVLLLVTYGFLLSNRLAEYPDSGRTPVLDKASISPTPAPRGDFRSTGERHLLGRV